MAFSQRLEVTGTLDSEGGTQQSCTLCLSFLGRKGTPFLYQRWYPFHIPTSQEQIT